MEKKEAELFFYCTLHIWVDSLFTPPQKGVLARAAMHVTM